MSKSITKEHLANDLSEKLGFSAKDSKGIVDVFFEEIRLILKSGEDLKLSNFGTFHLLKKKERLGRNPKTGKEAVITPRTVVTFYASEKIKNKISNDRQ